MRTGRPVVHLKLHTDDLHGASASCERLLRWHTERIDVRGSCYHALTFGGPLDGRIVECGTPRATWMPYVAVDEIAAVTERGRRLGATVLLEPRELPAGWRSVLATSEGREIALWQPTGPPGRESR